MAYKTPKAQISVPESNPESVLQIGDPIGGFAGYLRRAKSSSSGLVAQIFGENGPDADVITVLHLTQHLDNWVKITVWMVKDRNGRITKDEAGQHIKLTEFIGIIRRPQPSNSGQVAQFFGENGPNADAINVLNKSEYLDALVYVEMQQAAPGVHINDIGPMGQKAEQMDELQDRLTPTETQELKALQKRSEDAWKILRSSGFFRMEAVYHHLGRETEFEEWITGETCCHPGSKPCENTSVQAWRIPGNRKFSFIPLCREHMEMWENGMVTELADGSSPDAFLATHKITYLQRWTQQALRKKLKVPTGHTPTPHAVFAWALERKIDNIIPATFKTFLI